MRAVNTPARLWHSASREERQPVRNSLSATRNVECLTRPESHKYRRTVVCALNEARYNRAIAALNPHYWRNSDYANRFARSRLHQRHGFQQGRDRDRHRRGASSSSATGRWASRIRCCATRRWRCSSSSAARAPVPASRSAWPNWAAMLPSSTPTPRRSATATRPRRSARSTAATTTASPSASVTGTSATSTSTKSPRPAACRCSTCSAMSTTPSRSWPT